MAVLEIGNDRGTWSTGSITVEYSSKVILEICSSLKEALESTPAGLEGGGLLFGTRIGPVVRIEAFRPFACGYANGPEFVLSAADRTKFERVIGTSRNEPDLKSYEAVGWYRVHRKGEVVFAEQDRDTHDRYFRYPGHVALMFRAGEDGEFSVRIYAREVTGGIRGCAKQFACPVPPPPPASDEPVEPEPVKPAREARTALTWVVFAALLLLLAGGAAWATWEYFAPEADVLALRAVDRDGQLQIEWDRSAEPIRKGRSAKLDIVDGREKASIPLDREQLQHGSIAYTRKSGIVDVNMTIVRSPFHSSREYLRFIGPAETK